MLDDAMAGCASGFEQLYRAYAGVVAGYLRAQGADDAEGLTNQVFFDAFSALHRFRGAEDSFRSWLFTIAHRRMVDDRRRRARRPPMAQEDISGLPDRIMGDVEVDAMQRLSTERVRALCEALSPDQRDVLLLRMVASLSIDDTAAALGKTSTAVKALQRRAVNALRRSLVREGISP